MAVGRLQRAEDAPRLDAATSGSVLIREVFARHGVYDTTWRIAVEYDANLRYFSHEDLHPAYILKVLVKMRLGGESNRSLRKLLRKSR